MNYLIGIPLFVFLLAGYLITGSGAENADVMATPIMEFNLFSGATFKLTVDGIYLIIGVVFLFLEVIKATRTGGASVWDHVLSTFVFIGFLVAFLTVKRVGTEAFFILGMMSLVDVIAGFTITIASARRDLSMDRNPLG